MVGRILRALFLAPLLSACTHHVADLSLVSTRSVPVRPYILARGVSAQDCAHQILFVPVRTPRPDLGRLLDRLLTQVQKGNVLTEVTVEEHRIFSFFWNRECLRVRGTVGQLH